MIYTSKFKITQFSFLFIEFTLLLESNFPIASSSTKIKKEGKRKKKGISEIQCDNRGVASSQTHSL